ncbi:MAG: tRNA dimethylallyltransferase 1 [Cyclobacteriaceae bacterium]|nr:MAG: tRNA dimethylallyltransferase 1 [Cyclobacteriaceae bacterium]
MSRPVSAKKLLVIVGATAVGKTDVSIQLARRYQCPILSADSRQCYKELGIATAKPSAEVREEIPHYFIDSHSIHQPVTVVDFERFALDTLKVVFRKQDYCTMTGGSGLYVKAALEGLDPIPEVPDSIINNLEDRLKHQGLKDLVEELGKLDADVINTIDLHNPRRVVRALAVCRSTGKPYSSFRTGEKKERSFEIIKIGLKRDRDELYHRINSRMDHMIEQGLFNEARDLYDYRGQPALQTVGYQEIFAYLDGQYNYQEAVRLLKRNSRRYAKRQLTWFGKDQSVHWFHADDLQAITDFVDQVVAVS